MRTLFAVAVATFTFAAGAAAQTPGQGAVFINPMGQPFRAAPESTEAPIRLWLAHADTDQDQRIGRDEFVTEAMAFFTSSLDANHDGSVNSMESAAFWRAQAPEIFTARNAPPPAEPQRRRREAGGLWGAQEVDSARPGSPRSAPQRPRGRGAAQVAQPGIMLVAIPEPVMSCDRDFSRRIDAAEFQACAERRFVELDVNRDGHFTLDESEQARLMLAAYEQ